jgi:competence protein ComEC
MVRVPAFTLVWVAVSCVLGAAVVSPLSPADHICAIVALVVLTLAAARRNACATFRALVAVALVGSGVMTSWRNANAPLIVETRTQRFSGTIVGSRGSDGDVHGYVFALDAGPKVLVTLSQRLAQGSRAIVRGRLEPLDESRNPGGPSERSIYAESGVVGRIASATAIASRGDGSSIDARLAEMRASALAQLRAHLGEPGASIVAGELWGERSSLPPDLRAEFQETGTVHILVTAGLHVGLVAALALALFSALRFRRIAACTCTAALVWAFAIFSGAQLPALRAASMVTAALAARACGRATLSWNALALAAIAIVAIEPATVASASFWLSFCCVAAIFAAGSGIERALERFHFLPDRAREALVLTIATQLGTWPVIAAVFLQFTPYALIANLAVVPCVPATMLLGALQLSLSWSSPLAQAAANLNGWVLAWMLGIVHLIARAPNASIPMTPAPTWCIAAYEGALLVAAPLVRRGGATLAATLLLLSGTLVLYPPQTTDGRLRIVVLDVGQADAIVIQTPAHHVLLVDAGGRLERGPAGEDSAAEMIGERIVVPFLLRAGIHHLDAVILSHPHGDHVGGCRPVLDKIRVAEIADSGQTYGGHAYHDCLDTAAKDHVPIVYPRAGLVWRTNDGVTLTFLGPSLPLIGGRNAINDNSIAFILEYKHFRMLFTGDAGVAAEQRFLAEGIDLRADVLKVGHHGSAYSSSPAFISAVHPKYAIVSVGRHNIFGHPAPATLETLQRLDARIYRTDENGGVTIICDGATEDVSSVMMAGSDGDPPRRRSNRVRPHDPSAIFMQFLAGIHRRGTSAFRDRLRRTSQPVRPSGTIDARDDRAFRSNRLPHGRERRGNHSNRRQRPQRYPDVSLKTTPRFVMSGSSDTN